MVVSQLMVVGEEATFFKREREESLCGADDIGHVCMKSRTEIGLSPLPEFLLKKLGISGSWTEYMLFFGGIFS